MKPWVAEGYPMDAKCLEFLALIFMLSFPCLCFLFRRKSWFCLLENAAQNVPPSPARYREEHSRWLVTNHTKTTPNFWHISLSLLPSLWLCASTDSLLQTLLFSLLARQESWKKSRLDKNLLAKADETLSFHTRFEGAKQKALVVKVFIAFIVSSGIIECII